ncbi:MAG: hypothetical protein IPQ07_32775 [Myxococcales bacterium]|nr:hypothetical protein [Myxococcales bacterium]
MIDRPSGRESGPLAHASSLSMVVAPPASAGSQARRRGRITLAIGGVVAIGIALVASRSSGPAPTSASGSPSVGAPSLVRAAPMASGPNPCDEFVQATLQFDACLALPKASRDSVKEAGVNMQRLWASPTTPPEARANIAKSCKEATVGIRNGVAAACPK